MPMLVWLVLLLAVFVLSWWFHRDVVELPPYEDQAVGLWTEADFLVETHFDYHRLRYEERHFMHPEPGVRSYMISLLPTAVALLMIAFPDPPTSFWVAHLVSFAFAAVSVVLVMAAVRPFSGWMGSILLGIALASTPLFSVQTEMLGMDLPMTAFSLATAILLSRRRYFAAGASSTLAFGMKVTGGWLTALTLAFAVFDRFADRDGVDHRGVPSWRVLLSLGGLLLAQALLILWGDTSLEIRRLIEWPEAFRLPRGALWFPEVSLLAVLLALVTLVHVCREIRSVWRLAEARRWSSLLHGRSERGRLLAISWLVIVGFLATSLPYILIPRYATCPTAFLFLIAGLLLFPPNGLRWLSLAGFLCLTLFNAANGDGRFYPSPAFLAADAFDQDPGLHARSCPITERSREYLVDFRQTLEAMRSLEAIAGDAPVFLPLPHLFYATKPRLGYVARPLWTIDANRFSSAIAGFLDLVTSPQSPREILFVWTGRSRTSVPFPSADDAILFNDRLDPPLVVYRLLVDDLPKDRRHAEEWYLDQTWRRDWSLERAEARLAFLDATSREERAIREMGDALAWSSADSPARRRVKRQLSLLQRGESATSPARDALVNPEFYREMFLRRGGIEPRDDQGISSAKDGDDKQALFWKGIDELRRRDRDSAARVFAELAENREGVEARLSRIVLGDMRLERGDLDGAEAEYQKAAAGGPALAEAQDRLGWVRLQRGEWGAAADLFQHATELDDNLADTWEYWGIALARRGDTESAKACFQKATRLRRAARASGNPSR